MKFLASSLILVLASSALAAVPGTSTPSAAQIPPMASKIPTPRKGLSKKQVQNKKTAQSQKKIKKNQLVQSSRTPKPQSVQTSFRSKPAPISTSSVAPVKTSQISSPTANYAATSTAQTVSKKLEKPKPAAADKKFSAAITIAPTTNAIDYQDGSRADSLDSQIVVGYKFDAIKIGSLFMFSQDIRSQELSVSDPQITGTFNPFNPQGPLQISPYILTNIPASKESRAQTLQGGLGAGLKFGFAPNVLIKSLNLGASVSFTRNFFEYDTAQNGKVNSEYTSVQKVSVEYALGDFSLSAVFFNMNGFTPSGGLKQKFVHGEELGYNFSEHFAVALGHQNGGPGLKPNQMDSNIELFNDHSSQVYLGVTYAY